MNTLIKPSTNNGTLKGTRTPSGTPLVSPPIGGSSPAPPTDPGNPQNPTPIGNNTISSSGKDSPGTNSNSSNYDFSYPTSTDGKYFTATQALIYIGDLYIDEVVDLQFTYQGNRIPIYGYSSTNADAFGQGKRLVQGQFSVNLVTEGYLYVVLDQYAKKMSKAIPSIKQTNINSLSSAIANVGGGTQSVGAYSKPTTAEQQNTNAINQTNLDAIDQLAANLGPSGITAAKNNLNQDSNYRNAITMSVPFNIVINFTGGGRTVTRTLHDCILTSNDLQLDQSGSTVLDSYGFISRLAR